MHSKNNSHQTYELLHVSQQDLSNAAFFAEHLLSQGWHYEPWEIDWRMYLHQSAYVTSMVVAYCRPFAISRGNPKFPSKLLRVLDSEQKQLHERLLKLRHQVYAHSEIALRKVRPVVFEGKPSATEVLPAMRFDRNELILIRQMITVISIEVQGKLESLSNILANKT
ncbi:hypothetical protein [Psychromonas hadalis]|uniref:hypothetical protein n=1 Tax=Psychromonas hadalis TaxID=211669 RepID=UPI0003B79167|nr:hypothetical protein [Psychromonas hadalis]